MNKRNLIFLILLFFLKDVEMICNHRIYCNSTFLFLLNKFKLYNDSKTFVDMPIKTTIDLALDDFDKTIRNNPSLNDIKLFLNRNFDKEGTEVEEHQPNDRKENPRFLNQIKNEDLKKFGKEIHFIWKNLIRKFNFKKYCNDCVMF
jgi:alpha,alpha-trehalase